MKTKEELESLKGELDSLKSKLVELSDEELSIVTGGEASQPNMNYTSCINYNAPCA